MHGEITITGSVRVEERKDGRVWVATYRRADGSRTRKVLGRAWVKDSGRRNTRGGIVWRAADGTCPEGLLTPKHARKVLESMLHEERCKPRPPLRGQYRVTFGQAVEEWLHHRRVDKGLAESTLRSYANDSRRYLIPYFGADRILTSIDTDDIDELRTHLLNKDLSRCTVQKALVELHGLLAIAKRRRWIPYNPATDAERITFKRNRDLRVLTPEQVFAVARAAERRAPGTHWPALYVFAAFPGLRLGECRALRWYDIDFVGGRINVRRSQAVHAGAEATTKSGQSRMVPLIPQTAQSLAHLADRGFQTDPQDRVFPSNPGGRFDDNMARRLLYACLEDIGLGHLCEETRPGAGDRFTFHFLRHTFGTLTVQAFALRDVQAHVGHQSITTTELYLHHVPQHDAAARLGAFVARAIDPFGDHGVDELPDRSSRWEEAD